MFLELTDYYTIIRQDDLNRILDGNDINRITSERNAQALMESYLRSRFDVTAIFAATGSARSGLIIRYMIDIVIYDLHTRVSPLDINDSRIRRYDEAIAWLKDVRDGNLSPDLPKEPVDPDTGTSGNIFVTSSYPPQDFEF